MNQFIRTYQANLEPSLTPESYHHYDFDSIIVQDNSMIQPIQNFQKNLHTTQYTNKSTKSIKGRPKKKQINECIQNSSIKFLEHQKTFFSLIMCYCYKSLQANAKICKYGFLHDQIVRQSRFYKNVQKAISSNKLLKDSIYLTEIQNQLKKSQRLRQFLQKIIWVGPVKIIDEIFYLIGLILVRSKTVKNLILSNKNDRSRLIEISKQFGELIMDEQRDNLWGQLQYINLKNKSLNLDQQILEQIYVHFGEFLRVIGATIFLLRQNVEDNPYFIRYFEFENLQIDHNGKSKKKVEQKKVEQKYKQYAVQQYDSQSNQVYEDINYI